ncbi:hypothetical protein [Burkholderia multivorans]|uniref:hypothetical protein n=1 Tax=Burkholderia multivorans TaxID=87883 RepID=UPI001C22E16F|nr:hypothetical protein [Burkholderia multivorans]MBU9581341.1 hypothetical protein [Burkholderia multivorans]
MDLRNFVSAEISRETAVGLSGLVLGISGACLITHSPGGSSEWASWVQAVGSIGAIIGAFAVASRQAREERRQAKELRKLDREQTRAAVLAVAEHANREVSGIEAAFVAMSPMIFQMMRNSAPLFSLTSAIRALDAIPLHETGSADAVWALVSLKSSLEQLSSIVDNYVAAGPTANKHLFSTQMSGAKAMAQFAYDRLTAAMNQLSDAEHAV